MCERAFVGGGQSAVTCKGDRPSKRHLPFHVAGRADPMVGPAGYLAAIAMMQAGFPDIQWTLKETVAEADKVTALFTMRGTHAAPSSGFPPTGRGDCHVRHSQINRQTRLVSSAHAPRIASGTNAAPACTRTPTAAHRRLANVARNGTPFGGERAIRARRVPIARLGKPAGEGCKIWAGCDGSP